MTHATPETRRISAIDVATLDDLLNSAIEDAIPNALILNRGIRVTRVSPGEYLVETLRVRLERYQGVIASPFNRVGREPGNQ